TRIKRAVEAAQSDDAAGAEELARIAQKRIDEAASQGVLHRNTAARRKSRLARRVSALPNDH
ncbi:MAG: 30S ribosomal protein S20, partial [Acidimicrobiia bacterium]